MIFTCREGDQVEWRTKEGRKKKKGIQDTMNKSASSSAFIQITALKHTFVSERDRKSQPRGTVSEERWPRWIEKLLAVMQD